MKHKSGLGLILVLLSFAWILGSCASRGFNRGELAQQIGVSKPVYDDKDVKEAFAKKPNLPKPFRLGVYFKNPATNTRVNQSWRWTEEDRGLFSELGKELKAQGLISDAFPILSSAVPDESLKSLRLAAAHQQADALLIVGGASDLDRYINSWGWSYVLLAPAFFIKGSEADTLFVSNATLWDVRNEYLYLGAEAEGEAKETYIPAFGKSDKDLIAEAKATSLKNLASEFRKMVEGKTL